MTNDKRLSIMIVDDEDDERAQSLQPMHSKPTLANDEFADSTAVATIPKDPIESTSWSTVDVHKHRTASIGVVGVVCGRVTPLALVPYVDLPICGPAN